MNLLDKIYRYGIVPVIAIDKIEDAAPLAKALCQGGLSVAEVTYRTACAHDAMVEMKKACPEMLIGAGTVLTKEQVDSAIDAGAQFIVSPGLNEDIVRYCQEKQVPILPGVATPSDIEKAISLGLATVKFFPAEANGGLASIKAMSAPYGNMRFMPTGGINENNLSEYLSFNKIIACGGTWMVKSDLIKNKDFKTIEELTRKAVLKMLNIRLTNINIVKDKINQKNGLFMQRFLADTVQWIQSEKDIENGYFVYSTSNLDRAVFFMEQKEIKFDWDLAQYDTNNHLVSIVLKQSICDFNVHLIKEEK